MSLFDVIKLKDGRIATIIEIHEKSVWLEVENSPGEYEILMLDKNEI